MLKTRVITAVVLLAILFVMFQAVFAWAVWPMELIKSATEAVAGTVGGWLPEGHISLRQGRIRLARG